MLALLADPSARPLCTKLAPGLGFPDGWRTRWIVVPVGGEKLTIMIEGYGKNVFDRVEPAAQHVIDSLRVR
jgi:hypothetical protein